jgi:hypothetical protein
MSPVTDLPARQAPLAVPTCLADLANPIRWPERSTAEAVRSRPGPALHHRYGRLADLAYWWAGTRGDVDAAPPTAVHHLCLVPADPAPSPVPLPGVLTRRLTPPRDLADCLVWTRDTVDRAVDEGADLLLLTVPEPVGARVLDAWLNRVPVVRAVGWPGQTGTDDATWIRDVATLRDLLWRIRGLDEPDGLLRELDLPAMTAGTGAVLHAASRRTPVLLDGPGALACAALARRVSRPARGWWQVAQADDDPPATRMLALLGLDPLLRLGIRTDDGTGAALGLAVLRAAADLLGTGR